MNNWIPFALAATLFFSLSNTFTKIYQAKLGSGFGSIMFTVGAVVGAVAIAMLTRSTLPMQKSSSGITLAVISGLLWAIANILLLTAIGKQAPISIVMPLVVGGIGLGGALIGVLAFGETLSSIQIFGILTVLAGSIILSRS